MKSHLPIRFLVLSAIAVLALGCGSSGPRKGAIGTLCSDDSQCDSGLACRYNVCVDPSKGGEADLTQPLDTLGSEDSSTPPDTNVSEDQTPADQNQADLGKEGTCSPNGTIECLSESNAYRICTNGEWSNTTFCNRVPCEAQAGIPASGIRGGCVAGSGCGTTCDACPNYFAADPETATCRTSCKDQSGADNDAYCWAQVARCQDGVCVAVPKKKQGESCDGDLQCESGACVAAIKDGRFVPGLRVCCQAKCSDDPVGTCQGCLVDAGTCQTLNKRQRTDSSNKCESICEDPLPDPGCQSGYDALAASKIDAAHRIFIDRLRVDSTDSKCAFGAAITTLFLSFEDATKRFDPCNHPELQNSLAPILYELGGPLGLSLADRVFGPTGMLKQLNDARGLDSVPNAAKTGLSVTHYYMNGQTPANEKLPFQADYMVTTRDGFALVDKTTRSILRVACRDSENNVTIGVNAIAERYDVENGNTQAKCHAEFQNQPNTFQGETDDQMRRYMSRTGVGTNQLKWDQYSVVNNAPATGTISVSLYRRDGQGNWDEQDYFVISGTLNDRTSDLNAILTSGVGELAGFLSGNAPLIGRSPKFTFQFVADKVKAFVDGNLSAIVGFLATASDDASFSAEIKPSMFYLPADVDLRFERADAMLMLGAFRAVKAIATYLYAFRFDFAFEQNLDVKGLLCEQAIKVLNPLFLKTKLDATAFLAVHTTLRNDLKDAVTAMRQAMLLGKLSTVDEGPTRWQQLKDPAKALDTMANLLGAIESELSTLTGHLLPNASAQKRENDVVTPLGPVTAQFKAFFEKPFASTGDPPAIVPFFCATQPDKQETVTTMTDAFETAWLGSLFSPDILTVQNVEMKLTYTPSGETDPIDLDPGPIIRAFADSLFPLFGVLDVGN